MVGKWHLSPRKKSTKWQEANGYKQWKDVPEKIIANYYPQNFGFREYATGAFHKYYSNFDIKGNKVSPVKIDYKKYSKGTYRPLHRIELQTKLATTFIERHSAATTPFFLYLAYYGPHLPIDDIPLKQFKSMPVDFYQGRHKFPEHRKRCLEMLSLIDKGVGEILKKLRQHNLLENTIVFFISDNGAPSDTAKSAWNGSYNLPLRGEKGTLYDGAIRVPYIIYWKGKIQPQAYDAPVSTLDVAATALTLAGSKDTTSLDGIDLLPLLNRRGQNEQSRYLYFYFRNEAAIIQNQWKLLIRTNGDKELYDISEPGNELISLAGKYPAVVHQLKEELLKWLTQNGVYKF